jgi:hypothetical protein
VGLSKAIYDKSRVRYARKDKASQKRQKDLTTNLRRSKLEKYADHSLCRYFVDGFQVLLAITSQLRNTKICILQDRLKPYTNLHSCSCAPTQTRRGDSSKKSLIKLSDVVNDLLEVKFFDEGGNLGIVGWTSFCTFDKIRYLHSMLKSHGVVDNSFPSSMSSSATPTCRPRTVLPTPILSSMPQTLEIPYNSAVESFVHILPDPEPKKRKPNPIGKVEVMAHRFRQFFTDQT